MDGSRNYPEESDGRWHPGYQEPFSNSESRYGEDRYRVPEPRYGEPPYDEPAYGDATFGEQPLSGPPFGEQQPYSGPPFGDPTSGGQPLVPSFGEPGFASSPETGDLGRTPESFAGFEPRGGSTDSRLGSADGRLGTESRMGSVGSPGSPGPIAPVGPRSGMDLPPLPNNQDDQQRFHTEPLDRSALRRSGGAGAAGTLGGTGTLGGGTYGGAGTLGGGTHGGAGTLGGGTLGGAVPLGAAGGLGGAGGLSGAGALGDTGGSGAAGGPTTQIPAASLPDRASRSDRAMTGMDQGGGAAQGSGAIYRTKRAGVAALLAAIAVVAELLLIRILWTGEFGHTVAPGSVLAGIFAMVGVPLVTMGLYGLMTGAVAAAGPSPTRAWVRTPLAYLPIGLVLVVAASLAAR